MSVFAAGSAWSAIAGGDFLEVFDPTPGERVVAGQATLIRWNTNFAGNVRLQYHVVGSALQNITASTPNDGSFSWTPPDVASTNVQIRIQDAADGSPIDYSDAVFTICDPYFNKGAPIASGTGAPAQQVAFGDFNEDGVLDFVTTTATGLAVRLGQGAGGVGNGSFGSASALNFVASLRDVIAQDVNEDGRVDLVAADLAGDRLLIYAGGGANGTSNGTFGAPSAIPVDGARVVRAADFDEDGIVDLAVGRVGAATNDVLILRGLGFGAKGDGTFARSDSVATTGDVPDLETGDFNEDGRVDMAWLLPETAFLVVALGTGFGPYGDGHFAVSSVAFTPGAASALVTADFDRDGRMDLATTSLNQDALQVYLGNGTGSVGNGSFSLIAPLGDSYDQMTALGTEDLLEDNRPDLILFGNKASAIPPLAFLGDFDLCAAETTAVRLLAPQGSGLSWHPGQELEVRWTGSGYVGAVDVELSRDNGVRWETIGSGITETDWSWTVVPPASTTCHLRVRDSSLRNRVDTTFLTFTITNTTVGVTGGSARAAGLSAAWPNPGRAAIRLILTLAEPGDARVDVIDVAGRRVRSLARGFHEAGDHVLVWDGLRDDGKRAPSGVYFVDARGAGFRAERRIVRLD